MPSVSNQTFENHRSHDRVLAVLALIFFAGAITGVLGASLGSVMLASVASVLVALGALVLGYKARVYTLTMQDRIIRLEMRLRLAALLKGDLQGKDETLSLPQLIGLRFASDEELPDLVRKVLAESLSKPDEIKRLIKRWQADDLRI